MDLVAWQVVRSKVEGLRGHSTEGGRNPDGHPSEGDVAAREGSGPWRHHPLRTTGWVVAEQSRRKGRGSREG